MYISRIRYVPDQVDWVIVETVVRFPSPGSPGRSKERFRATSSSPVRMSVHVALQLHVLPARQSFSH